VSHSFYFFMTPTEFEGVMQAFSSSYQSELWRLPEPNDRAYPRRVGLDDLRPGSFLWCAPLEPNRLWSQREACEEAGAVAIVPPKFDRPNHAVFMGNIFAMSNAATESNRRFRKLRRQLQKRLPFNTTVASLYDLTKSAKGLARASAGVEAIFAQGAELHHFAAPNLRYAVTPRL
jgi:hypothetical protein